MQLPQENLWIEIPYGAGGRTRCWNGIYNSVNFGEVTEDGLDLIDVASGDVNAIVPEKLSQKTQLMLMWQ